jgi:hypothetical protein
MLAHGIDLTIYTYDVAEAKSSGIVGEIRDAREVLLDESSDWLLHGRPDHWTDIFRIEGFERDLGVWLDLDLIFVAPLLDTPYIIAGLPNGAVNGAALKLPKGSAALAFCLSVVRQRPVPLVAPFLPLHERIFGHLDVLRKRLTGKRLPRPNLGAGLTGYVMYHFWQDDAIRPWETFYPVSVDDMDVFHQSPEVIEAYLKPYTCAVHIWNRQYVNRYGKELPPEGSWLRGMVHKYDRLQVVPDLKTA